MSDERGEVSEVLERHKTKSKQRVTSNQQQATSNKQPATSNKQPATFYPV